MKLTIVTVWCGGKFYAISYLNDQKLRITSCICQTQEWVFNKCGFIPTSQTILEHMVEFNIDEI